MQDLRGMRIMQDVMTNEAATKPAAEANETPEQRKARLIKEAANDPRKFAALFGLEITGKTSTGYRTRRASR